MTRPRGWMDGSVDTMDARLTPYMRHDTAHNNNSILQTKEDIGLLDHPETLVQNESPLDALIGSAEDKALALETIRESVTLLKNEKGFLPLDANRTLNILVVGPTGDSLSYQCGGWTIHWHGPLGDHEIPYGTTLVEGLQQLAAAGSTVDFLEGVDAQGKWVTDRDRLADRARQADVIVLSVGEHAYAEAAANIPDVDLPRGQHDLATLLASASDAPIVTVLFEGRPRLLGAFCLCLPCCCPHLARSTINPVNPLTHPSFPPPVLWQAPSPPSPPRSSTATCLAPTAGSAWPR